MYYVLCREDRKPNGDLGRMVLATKRPFMDFSAALKYMMSVAPSRVPTVVATAAYRDEIDKVHIIPPDIAADDYRATCNRLREMQEEHDQRKARQEKPTLRIVRDTKDE